MKRLVPRAVLLNLLVFACFAHAYAAKVVYIGSSATDETTLRQVQAASQFYGIDLVMLQPDESAIVDRIRDPETIAVILDGDSLAALSQERILEAQASRKHIPILIAGIHAGEDLAALQRWSSGAVTDIGKFDGGRGGSYAIANVTGITRQLSGIQLPMRNGTAAYLKVMGDTEAIMQAKAGDKEFPVFVRQTRGGTELFLAAQGTPVDVPVTADPHRQLPIFASLAPDLMFLHYAAGNRAWHATGSYANLTIDDAWLREPYGYVNYEGLLREMKQHRFHTTMAFIPWNYDRSEPAMVKLFATNPNFFSICVHGNDHVHQEFGPLASHPLSKQIDDMRQAVARMEKFHQITGIPYDRVMVFPHSIAPLATFGELKRASYIATANSLNVPSDADPTNQLDLALRTTTLQYANFPSMRRYSAEVDVPVAQIAIDLFLGNPTLFYVHQGFFADGMDRFNQTADMVNQLEPSVQWQGLGYIASHSYLVRDGDDGNVHVKLLTATASLHNNENHAVVYSLEKSEDFALPVTVLVDGKPAPYERSQNLLRLNLPIRPGQSCNVAVQYGSPLDTAAIALGKTSLSVAVIRHLSDFRDDVVSRSTMGRHFIHAYAEDESPWNRAAGCVAILIVIGIVIRSARRSRTKRTFAPVAADGGLLDPPTLD